MVYSIPVRGGDQPIWHGEILARYLDEIPPVQ
jgi:hypothetical protein